MNKNHIIPSAIRSIELQSETIKELTPYINEAFEQAVIQIAYSKGRLVLSGIGKSAIVGQKIAATMNSTGTPALFMHAADAIHGDLGMIQEEDIILVISKSGDSPEIKVLLPLLKGFGNTIIGMGGNVDSYLATHCNIFINTTVRQEACPNNLAPTTSTTAQMVMGDALAVCLMELKGFNSNDFAKFHPGGALGKKLYLKVSDVLTAQIAPQVKTSSSIKEIIIEITKNRIGAVAVIDEANSLAGIITDGDIRRMLENNEVIESLQAKDIMSEQPKKIDADALAIEALSCMREFNINHLVLMAEGKYKGIIHLQDLIREGII